MNYIENWLHFYDTTESFEIHRKQGVINPDSICFLRETGQIYTQNSLFGICRERFEALEQLALAHDAKIKDILGIEGPSVDDGIINNISDLVNFLDGFTDQDNLKDFLETMKDGLQKQISSVQSELSDRITSIEDNINNDNQELHNLIENINNNISTINIRLGNHDNSISVLSTTLSSHIRDYNILSENYNNFKSYVENSLDTLNSNVGSLNASLTLLSSFYEELNRKFEGIDDKIVEINTLIDSVNLTVRELQDRFGQALADIAAFKLDVNRTIEDFKATVGEPDGIAPLDSSGQVPAANLPSYVDDVLEYATLAAFPLTGESGKIYVALDTNLQYRWSGSTYVEISKSLGLGETASTAYPGNKGKKNADSIAAHKADTNNPHNVTKVQLGLNNVDNTRDIDKPISTATQAALDDILDSVNNNSDTINSIKSTTLSKIDSISFSSSGASINYTDFTGNQFGADGTAKQLLIPAASSTKLGLMSEDDKVNVDYLKDRTYTSIDVYTKPKDISPGTVYTLHGAKPSLPAFKNSLILTPSSLAVKLIANESKNEIAIDIARGSTDGFGILNEDEYTKFKDLKTQAALDADIDNKIAAAASAISTDELNSILI